MHSISQNDSQTHAVAISLIVVNYNGASLLPNCVESALATLPPDGELIVVDNASTDESLAVLARYGERVRMVRSPRNIGFGRASNLGVAAARGDVLVFLNPDVTFVPGWTEPLQAAALSDPRIGLLCPQMLYPDEPVRSGHTTWLVEHAMLPGCGLTARRDAWLALGGFDETFFLYWEDTELCWRAWLLGWRVVSVGGSSIYHQRGATTGAFGRWDAARACNSLYTYLKLMRWPVAAMYVLQLLATCCAKALLHPTLAPALAQAWIWNILHLPVTLGSRCAIKGRRVGSYYQLERMIRQDNRHLRAHRAERADSRQEKAGVRRREIDHRPPATDHRSPI